MIVLHGGNEFVASSRDADRSWVSVLAGRPLLVWPAASEPRNVPRVLATARTHFLALDVEIRPLVDEGPTRRTCLEDGVGGLAIPGGDPARLLAAVAAAPDPDEVRVILAELAADRLLFGASAGAMLLGAEVVRPDGTYLGRGLGLVRDRVVVPHATPAAVARVGEVVARLDPSGRLAVLPVAEGRIELVPSRED